MTPSPSIDEIFGRGADNFAALASRIELELSARAARYKFLPLEEYAQLMTHDAAHAQRIYWNELVGRAHFAAASSILRSAQWLKGVQFSREQNLYLPFCANLRSLIESAADSLAGVDGVAQTLAEARGDVNDALGLKSSQLTTSQELEDQLIHFSHGRKLAKGEVAPQSHSAKSAKAYIEQLEKLGLAQSHAIYGLLCQATHPAADSLSHFLSEMGELDFALFPRNDRANIAALIHKHQMFLHALLRYAFNQPIILLRVLLYIDLPEYHSAEISRLDLSAMPGWQKCAKLMGVAP
ncbi:hypothetical protein HJC22_16795 [Corallococcus exiguus]|uniref:hypothetical protein n=1 Tax=Corallococcus exiguus TaxID=83462 RepID=UPI001471A1A0|nr:hypothetical protein [Corallococcus exiguus]NNC17378.1 hypothetical protein [Corallococcus exiguus]